MISSRHKPAFPVPAANKAKGMTKVEYLAQQLYIHNDLSIGNAIKEAHQFYDLIEGSEGEENES